MAFSKIKIPNISLNDPSLITYYENTKDSGSFLISFFTSLQELNPMNYNGIIHRNIIAIVGRTIEKRKKLLCEYYKIKGILDREKNDTHEGRDRKLEDQLGELSKLLAAESYENQRLNEEIRNIRKENLKNIQKLRVENVNLRDTVEESDERYDSLKKILEDSVKQNEKITAELENEKEKYINLMLNIESTDQYKKKIRQKNEEIEGLEDRIQLMMDEKKELVTEYDMKLRQEKEKIQKLGDQIVVLTEENKKTLIDCDLKMTKEQERTKEVEEKLDKIMERRNWWIQQANLPSFFHDDCINWNKGKPSSKEHEAISKCLESSSKSVETNEIIAEASEKKAISSCDEPPNKKSKPSPSIEKGHGTPVLQTTLSAAPSNCFHASAPFRLNNGVTGVFITPDLHHGPHSNFLQQNNGENGINENSNGQLG